MTRRLVMEDNDLLLLAAKAAGLEAGVIHQRPHRRCDMGWTPWNPLDDDGDALRLAVTLNLRIECMVGQSAARTFDGLHAGACDYPVRKDDGCAREHEQDGYAATRRAIVRAAAAMAGQG
jgi:hypothetical protein